MKKKFQQTIWKYCIPIRWGVGLPTMPYYYNNIVYYLSFSKESLVETINGTDTSGLEQSNIVDKRCWAWACGLTPINNKNTIVFKPYILVPCCEPHFSVHSTEKWGSQQGNYIFLYCGETIILFIYHPRPRLKSSLLERERKIYQSTWNHIIHQAHHRNQRPGRNVFGALPW